MEEKKSFTLIDEKGTEVEYDVLFTFESDEFKKTYIVYTDNTKDEEDNIKVFASILEEENEDRKLLPIEDEKEWKVVETILNSVQSQLDKENAE